MRVAAVVNRFNRGTVRSVGRPGDCNDWSDGLITTDK